MTAKGIDTVTMRFTSPEWDRISGLERVYERHFAAGWSSQDHDGDDNPDGNCARTYAGVTQHYKACWYYNLGADADPPDDDGGVGPHVEKLVLSDMHLAPQPNGGGYSQVNRIARFARW
jgi:hypothetical protein